MSQGSDKMLFRDSLVALQHHWHVTCDSRSEALETIGFKMLKTGRRGPQATRFPEVQAIRKNRPDSCVFWETSCGLNVCKITSRELSNELNTTFWKNPEATGFCGNCLESRAARENASQTSFFSNSWHPKRRPNVAAPRFESSVGTLAAFVFVVLTDTAAGG
jgi:hypothetical protein